MIGKFIFVICACDVMAFWGRYEKPVEVVMLARSRAEKDITRTKIINDVNYKPRPRGCPCAFDELNSVQNKEEPPSRKIIEPTILKIQTLKYLRKITRLPVDVLVHDPVWIRAWKIVFKDTEPISPVCDPKAKYRTFDGSCNNLKNPVLGTPFQPQARFLKPDYEDDIELARTKSEDGHPLPNVRDISNIVSPSMQGTCFDEENTVMVISWGSLVTMDTLETPSTSSDSKGRPITCCGRAPRSECIPIQVPRNDPFLNIRCMDLVRKSPSLSDSSRPGRRQIINQLTSFLDSSQIYGLSEAANHKIRTFNKGLIDIGRYGIPAKRANIDELITQTALSRLHNIYAKELNKINPHWTDERLFQETRRIIIAIAQKITYDEYLPTFLNFETREKYCLRSTCTLYDEKEDPSIRVGYSAGAGRFGHSQIPPFRELLKVIRITNEPTSPLELERLVDGVINEKGACVDAKFEDIIRDQLFSDRSGNSYDLLAINTKRGRDTGLPSYNRWREYCGLPKAYTFIAGPGGLVDHSQENARTLQRAYRTPEQIDLYIGGLSEKPLPGGRVGPTFSCILANQYRAFKVADRFFWNRHTRNGFTKSQMRSIKKITLSKVICETYDRSMIQRNVFSIQSRRNPLVSCADLPGINLKLWRSRKRRY